MWNSIRRGFSFLGQAVEMARRDADLIKPSFFGLGVSLIVSVLGILPIVGVALLPLNDNTPVKQGLFFGLGAALIFAQYTVAYIFSGMTAYLVYGYLAEGDGQMDKAWAIIQRDWLDLVSLAAASTLVKLLENALRGNGRRRNPLGGILANVLETVWTTATFFILPAMVIEDLDLGQAIKRATYIVKNNLLLVAVTEIGVSGVVGFVSFILVVISVLLGVGVAVAFSGLGQTLTLVGIGIAVLIAGTLIGVITALGSYVTTAYHTCLFIWAREAERALAAGHSLQSVAAPAPVAAVLG